MSPTRGRTTSPTPSGPSPRSTDGRPEGTEGTRHGGRLDLNGRNRRNDESPWSRRSTISGGEGVTRRFPPVPRVDTKRRSGTETGQPERGLEWSTRKTCCVQEFVGDEQPCINRRGFQQERETRQPRLPSRSQTSCRIGALYATQTHTGPVSGSPRDLGLPGSNYKDLCT